MKCVYCGKKIKKNMEKCPNCDAINPDYERVVISDPKTIDELKEWYKAMNLPDENVTRFFIGTDYKEPKAFGIYKDKKSGEFVVYKNKDTGERKIRYQGTDEAYAVNELFLKLKSEILNQKKNNNKKSSNEYEKKAKSRIFIFLTSFVLLSFILMKFFGMFRGWFLFDVFAVILYYLTAILICSVFHELDFKIGKRITEVLMVIFTVVYLVIGFSGYDNGYYKINDTYYFKSNSYWYYYDTEYNKWESSDEPYYSGNLSDYLDSYDSPSGPSITADVQDSDAWVVDHTGGSSDSDYSWDSGSSWDSGGTDWGSDW